MRTRMYGGVRGRKTKVGRKLSFSSYSIWYPEPGSNRHGLLHWCLRPARLPIPPSGLVLVSEDRHMKDRPSG